MMFDKFEILLLERKFQENCNLFPASSKVVVQVKRFFLNRKNVHQSNLRENLHTIIMWELFASPRVLAWDYHVILVEVFGNLILLKALCGFDS